MKRLSYIGIARGFAALAGVIIGSSSLLSGCVNAVEESGPTESYTNAREDAFGIIKDSSIKNWSALWHMSQTGSIQFCIKNASGSELQRVQSAAKSAVNFWIDLMNQTPPDSSYPAWNRSSISVGFGCSSRSYTISMFTGRSNCNYVGKTINLGHDFKTAVLTHEFGHSMGLADTYNYAGGTIAGQPASMMQSGQASKDDKFGVWALWKFIVTGRMECGPGYVSQGKGNLAKDVLCRPSQGGQDDQGGADCRYACQAYGYTEGQCSGGWLCKDGCMKQVTSCPSSGGGSGSCEYTCTSRQEGQCYAGAWRCRSGCWVRSSC